MKSHILTLTENVKGGLNALDYLINRPISNMVGMGMIYGPPGVGKTHFGLRMSLERGYIYYSICANDTPKSFTKKLLYAVMNNYDTVQEEKLLGTTSVLFDRIVNEINIHTTNEHIPVLMIDEVDYALTRQREYLLGTIRDIVDHTAAVAILIGMEEARNKLLKCNRHYFDRCNYFCEFHKVAKKDAMKIAKELSEIELADDFRELIGTMCQGDIRNVLKFVYSAEKAAKINNMKSINLQQWEALSK